MEKTNPRAKNLMNIILLYHWISFPGTEPGNGVESKS